MKTCLIVDDSRVIRHVTRGFMEKLGFSVEEADSGLTALESCRRQMPVMDGMTFLVNLRDMPKGRQPKVLFCTTENDIGRMSRALEAGADEFVMKPFDQHILSEKLAQVGAL